jgi:outer membrane protein OmpA-like peptidoglycan-associated protein
VTSLNDRNLNSPDVLLRRKAAVESGMILFETGSWELSSEQKVRLVQLLGTVRNLIRTAEASHAELQIILVGHSDSTGPEVTNAPLSEARARKVMQELVDAGIDARYLRARGAGTAEPVRQEESASDLQFNRSVTFQVNPESRPK